MSREMRQLENRWRRGDAWHKRIERLEIHNLRGWAGQPIEFQFPITAIVGENGVGKTSVLQAAAAIYRTPGGDRLFASDFFPDTPWETVQDAKVEYRVREGDQQRTGSVRKPSSRWRGNPERPVRPVEYIDLRRTQPVASRTGYAKIAKPQFEESQSQPFSNEEFGRLCDIMGRRYSLAKLSLSTADESRWVTVVEDDGQLYSAFHQGAGETALVDLLGHQLPNQAVVLIDEIETSLHPRAQRRLIRDLATMCRLQQLQIILTTHSPYVLEELPPEARLYVMQTGDGREIVHGVSPFFAMTKMDEEPHPELDVYVEDEAAAAMLREIIVHRERNLVQRCQFIPFGAASVGQALGTMVTQNRFPRPSVVFLDGDQDPSDGCLLLPGDDAPERVAFEALAAAGWPTVAERVGRGHAEVADACTRAMSQYDHHNWTAAAADALVLGGDTLWQALCAAWASSCLSDVQSGAIVDDLRGAVNGRVGPAPRP